MGHILYWIEGQEMLELGVVPQALWREGETSWVMDKVRLSLVGKKDGLYNGRV